MGLRAVVRGRQLLFLLNFPMPRCWRKVFGLNRGCFPKGAPLALPVLSLIREPFCVRDFGGDLFFRAVFLDDFMLEKDMMFLCCFFIVVSAWCMESSVQHSIGESLNLTWRGGQTLCRVCAVDGKDAVFFSCGKEELSVEWFRTDCFQDGMVMKALFWEKGVDAVSHASLRSAPGHLCGGLIVQGPECFHVAPVVHFPLKSVDRGGAQCVCVYSCTEDSFVMKRVLCKCVGGLEYFVQMCVPYDNLRKVRVCWGSDASSGELDSMSTYFKFGKSVVHDTLRFC